MSTIPNQSRVFDPFSPFGSDTVNAHTRSITFEEDGLLNINSLQVSMDSTNNIIVSSGYIIKDDVLINITSDHIVDFTDPDHYYFNNSPYPGEGGYFYIVLDYSYDKSNIQQAKIKILKDSERSLYSSLENLFLLKVVLLDSISPYSPLSITDYDPEDLSIQRQFIKTYTNTFYESPSFLKERDQGRLGYSVNRDSYFLGYNNRWSELSLASVIVPVNVDSTASFEGMVCYVDSNNYAQPSISTSYNTGVDGCLITISDDLQTGTILTVGYVQNIMVETGITINKGDILYLSTIDAGKVTNIKPYGIFQIIGRALTNGNDTTPIEAIFSPKLLIAFHLQGIITSWLYDSISGNYYADIDATPILAEPSNLFLTSFYDNTSSLEIKPIKVEIRESNIVRVYFSDSNHNINYIISNGKKDIPEEGSGGSTIIDNHSLFYNLDYATSGHTGFSQTPHDNTEHSETYILSTDVTYENLNINGFVGSLASQIAAGNHTHPEYVDVPTTTIMLFESDIVITGYSLLTGVNDELVYITKGSAAGGEVGGTLKSGSTWTQPIHVHTISTDGSHTHTTNDTVLTIANLPAHTHTYSAMGPDQESLYLNVAPTAERMSNPAGVYTEYTGSGLGHGHGVTGSSGSHAHGGNTELTSGSTPNTWRPYGRNMTRQQRI